MKKRLEIIRKSLLEIKNFAQIAAFNETRTITGKLVDGAWEKHVHEVFEVRILFHCTPEGEVDCSQIEDIHITPPYQMHNGVDASEFHRMVVIQISEKELIFDEFGSSHYVFSLPDETEKTIRISHIEFAFPAAALMNYWLNQDDDFEYLHSIIVLLFTLLEKMSKLSQINNLLPADAIAVYIRSNYYRKDLSVSEIAEKYGYSPNYIQKVFKSKWNCTLVEYIRQTRLNAARLLLQQQRWQIKDVASMCGFSYVHYFGKCYRKYFGILPSEEK